MRAEKWILSAGGPDIGIAGNPANRPDYEIAYQNYIFSDGNYDRAVAAVGSVFANGEHPSTNPALTYYQYYGSYYDQTHP
jgi:hypothetical protein